MPFSSTEQGPGGSGQIDTGALASACNSDCRFQDAGWAETPASVESLLLNKVFGTALRLLAPIGIRTGLGTMVASVYGCRIKERGAPKKSRPSGKTRLVPS